MAGKPQRAHKVTSRGPRSRAGFRAALCSLCVSRRVKSSAVDAMIDLPRQWPQGGVQDAIGRTHEHRNGSPGQGILGMRQRKEDKGKYGGTKGFNKERVDFVANIVIVETVHVCVRESVPISEHATK